MLQLNCGRTEKIDPQRGRRFIFDTIVDYLMNGNANGMVFIIDELIQLLTNPVDENRLFQELFSFMNRALPFEESDSQVSPVFTHPDACFMESVTEWLVYLSDLPMMSISEKAKMHLASLIESGYSSIVSALDTSKRPDGLKLEIGMFLRALGSNKLSIFESIAKNNTRSKSIIDRIYSKKILESLDDPGEYSTIQIPFIMRKGDECLIWSFDGYVNFLSKVTRKHDKTIKNKLALLRGKDSSQSSDAVHMEKINLRCTDALNHEMATLNALMKITVDMIDSGRLDEKLIPNNLFTYYDFNTIHLHEDEKPSSIPGIGDDNTWFLSSNWIGDASKSLRLFCQA